MSIQDKLQQLAESHELQVSELPKGELFTSGEQFERYVKGYEDFLSRNPQGIQLRPVALVDRDFVDDLEDDEGLQLLEFLGVNINTQLNCVSISSTLGVITLSPKQLENLEEALKLAKSQLA